MIMFIYTYSIFKHVFVYDTSLLQVHYLFLSCILILPFMLSSHLFSYTSIISPCPLSSILVQFCGNSQSYRTLSDKSSECMANYNYTDHELFTKYEEQDKSDENQQVSQYFHTPALVFHFVLSLYSSSCYSDPLPILSVRLHFFEL